jgi:hypothetical protein
MRRFIKAAPPATYLLFNVAGLARYCPLWPAIARYCPPRHPTHWHPRLLSRIAVYDVASNIPATSSNAFEPSLIEFNCSL